MLTALRPDVVFNALHGTPGEDGTVQGMLDLMQIPYTHSGCTTSAIAIDKELTKAVLVPHGMRMPAGKMVESKSLYEADPMARPYVLKPVNEGSSVGVAIVTERRQLRQSDQRAGERPVAAFRPAARRAVHPRARADRRGAGRRSAVRHRTEVPQGEFYDFDGQIYRRR